MKSSVEYISVTVHHAFILAISQQYKSSRSCCCSRSSWPLAAARLTQTASALRGAVLRIFSGWPTIGAICIARKIVDTKHVAGWGGSTCPVAPLAQALVGRRKQRRWERAAPARQLAHLLQHRILRRPIRWVGQRGRIRARAAAPQNLVHASKRIVAEDVAQTAGKQYANFAIFPPTFRHHASQHHAVHSNKHANLSVLRSSCRDI
jgi:hypothetical protein